MSFFVSVEHCEEELTFPIPQFILYSFLFFSLRFSCLKKEKNMQPLNFFFFLIDTVMCIWLLAGFFFFLIYFFRFSKNKYRLDVQILVHNYIVWTIGSISQWDIVLAIANIASGTLFLWPLPTTAGCLAVQMDQILLHMHINHKSRTLKLTRDPATSSMRYRTDTTC